MPKFLMRSPDSTVMASMLIKVVLIVVLSLWSCLAQDMPTCIAIRHFKVADPLRSPYLPEQIGCPHGGRNNGSSIVPGTSYATGLTFLKPQTLRRGQTVVFELAIESGCLVPTTANFRLKFNRNLSATGDLGFDAHRGVLCAYVDMADGLTSGTSRALVTSYSTLVYNQTAEYFHALLTVDQLERSTTVVQIWVATKDSQTRYSGSSSPSAIGAASIDAATETRALDVDNDLNGTVVTLGAEGRATAASATAVSDAEGWTLPLDTPVMVAGQQEHSDIDISPQRFTVSISTGNSFFDMPGQEISFMLTVQNHGPSSLHHLFMISNASRVSTCTPSNAVELKAEEFAFCQVTHLVTQSDLDAGSITITASMSGQSLDPMQPRTMYLVAAEPHTIMAQQRPSLLLNTVALPPIRAAEGSQVRFVYTLMNTGNIRVLLPHPTHPSDTATPPGSSEQPVPTPASTTTDHGLFLQAPRMQHIFCPPTPIMLAPGQSIACEGMATVTAADASSCIIASSATARALNPLSMEEVVKSNSVVVGLCQRSIADDEEMDGVSAKKAVGADSVDGMRDAAMEASDGTRGVGTSEGDGKDAGPGMRDGRVQAAAVSGEKPRNEPFLMKLEVSLQDTEFVGAGSHVSLIFTLTNTGAASILTPISLVNTPCSWTTPLPPGSTLTCPHTLIASTEDALSGQISFTTWASTSTSPPSRSHLHRTLISTPPSQMPPTPTPASNTLSLLIPAAKFHSLSLTIVSATDTFTRTGDNLRYMLEVMNTGNAVLTGPFVISSSLSPQGMLPCPNTPVMLDPKQSFTCTYSHKITSHDMIDGSVVHEVAAAANNAMGVQVEGGRRPNGGLAVHTLPAVAYAQLLGLNEDVFNVY